MGKETKLGLFVLLGVFMLVISILLLGDFQFQGRYYLNILFADVAGLPSKASVKIAGVEVGGVKSISLEGGLAKVRVWIKDDVRIHEDARAGIVSTGIIGSKFLEIQPGSADAPLLSDGATLRGTDPVSFDKVVEQVMKQINNLTKSFQGPAGQSLGENLSASISNLKDITGSLKNVITKQEQKLVEIVDNVHSFSGDLACITSENREDIRATIAEIRAVAARLDHITAQIDSGRGTVGALISDTEMGDDLKATVAEVKDAAKEAKRVLRRVNLIETQWDYQLRYDWKYNAYRNDIGLRVLPTPEKFYFFGASNLGEKPGSGEPPRTDPEELNTFNFHVGRVVGPATVYAGLIRSKGGVGGSVKPFPNHTTLRNVEITAQGYDFFRKRPVARPVINTGARVAVTQWAYAGVQAEDLYYRSSLNAYLNLVFRDDDIAYLLGLIGLAKP